MYKHIGLLTFGLIVSMLSYFLIDFMHYIKPTELTIASVVGQFTIAIIGFYLLGKSIWFVVEVNLEEESK
jgi:hypothetical protein